MKSVILTLVVLFFVVTPVSGQLLSDATGLVKRLDVQTSGHIFEIILTSNFDLTDYRFDKDQKQIVLYIDSGLENNLGEIIIPQNLLSGDFIFYLNDQEFFPKIQSNEKIHFITLNFTGSDSNVITIRGSEYLSGLTEIVSIENEIPLTSETSSDNYFVLFIIAGILIIIVVSAVIKIQKNKN